MYEHKSEPLISGQEFARRLGRQALYAVVLVAGSVVVGMTGYHWIAGQGWVDAFLNTTMLLGGMGPVGELSSNAAKIFAGCFALYAGLVFLAVSILLLTPVFHRVLHRFHVEITGKESK